MAPSMASVESEKAINVSQGAKSSPSQNESENVQVGNSLELVEDSVEIPKAYQGGPVQPPQSEDLDEVDEFYSLSPQGKASAARQQAAARDTGVANAASKAPKYSNHQLHDSDINTQRKETAKARNAVDELLTRGATIHKPGQTKKRQSLADADGNS